MASTIDIVPTILKLCGIDPLPDFEGTDLLGPAPAAEEDQAVFMQYGNIAYALRTPRWKLIQGPPRHPYSRSAALPVALYDLDHDPDEKQNVAEAYPERTAELMTKLHDTKLRLKQAAPQAQGELTEKDLERLKSLGYVQ